MNFTTITANEEALLKNEVKIKKYEELFAHITDSIKLNDLSSLSSFLSPKSELEISSHLMNLGLKNTGAMKAVFGGFGIYDHYVPSAVWQLAGRGDFSTGYTPYQPEASQGTLQAIYEYQTALAQLYSMEIANASLYDGATAAAEAALMACRIKKRYSVAVSEGVNPQYIEVLKTFLSGTGIKINKIPLKDGITDFKSDKACQILKEEHAAVIQASPNFLGFLEDLNLGREASNDTGALFITVSSPVSLGLIEPPGKYGADIAVGEGQSMGLGMYMGGNTIGHFCSKMEFIRQVPGRIVGLSTDRSGLPGYCLTYQTREQHIKREKATSNICTNQALNALANLIYMSLMGSDGLKEVALSSHNKAVYMAESISKINGYDIAADHAFFQEFLYFTRQSPEKTLEKLLDTGIAGGVKISSKQSGFDRDGILIALTEKKTKEAIDKYLDVLKSL